MAIPNIYLKRAEKIYDKFVNQENDEHIFLQDDSKNSYEFEKVAMIPLQKEKKQLYAILKPITPIEGVGESEALVFHFKKKLFSYTLVYVSDPAIVDEVFNVYDNLSHE